MNVALIMAGGLGQTLLQDIPKQFLNVYDKPIIIYALEAFQRHEQIDKIVVSCLEGWQEMCRAYARQFGIDKLDLIVTGGTDGQSSARNGLNEMRGWCRDDDIIVVHDAIRPMVTEEVITDCINTCRKHGCAVAAVRCHEPVVKSRNGLSGNESMERDEVMRIQTPQAFCYGKLLWAHEEAAKRGISGVIHMSTILTSLGESLYFSKGSDKNLKILTLEDLDMFKALYITRQDDWIKLQDGRTDA